MDPTDFPRRGAGDASRGAPRPCSVLVDQIRDGPTHLAVDELLLDQVSQASAPTRTYLRFYDWTRPVLSLGWAQRASRVVDFDFCRHHGIRIVHRATGGKAVLHHREATYSVVSNDRSLFSAWSIEGTYRRIASALRRGLHLLGISTSLAPSEIRPKRNPGAGPSNACFALSGPQEILSGGRKLVGSAQRRTRKGFLQHGSILLDFDPSLLEGALRGPMPPDLASDIATVRSCLGHVPDFAAIRACLIQGFSHAFPARIEPEPLDPAIRSGAEELGETRLICSGLAESRRPVRPEACRLLSSPGTKRP